jgi:hypothetical protein
MSKYKEKNIVILRHRGVPGVGTLPDGTKVYKTSRIWIPEYGRFIPCADYGETDGHFIYEIPEKLAKRFPGPIYRCSCGSMAVISGWEGYEYGASPAGLMFICQEHATTQRHATGGSRWI